MLRHAVLAALFAVAAGPTLAKPDTVTEGMNTVWEVLWHQIGTPTRLVRWDREIKVRVTGVDLAMHKQYTLQALNDVAAVAGIKVTDVSDRWDAAQQANVNIEITPDTALSEAQPCETRINFAQETSLDGAATQMRTGDVRRCVYHEMMHVMGVRGHPAGETVLSYFTTHTGSLLPLDKVMLRAWYSPRSHGGMTPFEILPVLADELVAVSPDKTAAKIACNAFIADTVKRMEAFADGGGDVPSIVRKSGKASDAGVRLGRMEVSYFRRAVGRPGPGARRAGAAACIRDGQPKRPGTPEHRHEPHGTGQRPAAVLI